MQLNDMNERNKSNVMKADGMLIVAINHICARSEDRRRQHEEPGGGGGGLCQRKY